MQKSGPVTFIQIWPTQINQERHDLIMTSKGAAGIVGRTRQFRGEIDLGAHVHKMSAFHLVSSKAPFVLMSL